jgi:HTH-type transcriptional regulator/antitoxin HigA
MNITDEFKTPGQYIQHLLDEREWNQTVLSIVLEASQATISQIINGKGRLDASLALALSEVFSVPVENFMVLQSAYDLASARVVAKPNPKRFTRAHLFNGLPITEMIKRGWLPGVTDIKNMDSVEKGLAKFFDVSTPSEIEVLPHAAKKTEASVPMSPAQLAWLYRVKEIASEMLVAKYSPDAVTSAIPKLKSLLFSKEEARKVPRILAECGIRFVIVESLPSAKIDGVCYWLNDRSPVIGMSLRHDRIDNFWFVLRHELEHVVLRHGLSSAMFDADVESNPSDSPLADEERLANTAAAEFCVPSKLMQGFIARKAPYFTQQDLLGFSAMLKVHPGLVAGQLRRTTARFDLFSNHLVKIRSVVAPNAVVDGWGDVAPVGI